MIVFVWSLVSSVVDLTRRHRLQRAIEHFLSEQEEKRERMLLCRRIGQEVLRGVSSSSGLARFASAPSLHNQVEEEQPLYQCEQGEVLATGCERLIATDWRMSAAPAPSADRLVYFVAEADPVERGERRREGEGGAGGDRDMQAETVYLSRVCSRVGWHRTLAGRALFCCTPQVLGEVLFAWSERKLREDSHGGLVQRIHTVWMEQAAPSTGREGMSNAVALLPQHKSSSLASSLLALHARPLPLLEQLFWGDGHGNAFTQALRSRFVSEGALNGEPGAFVLPRSLLTDRRRNRSECSEAQSLPPPTRARSPLAIEYTGAGGGGDIESKWSARCSEPVSFRERREYAASLPSPGSTATLAEEGGSGRGSDRDRSLERRSFIEQTRRQRERFDRFDYRTLPSSYRTPSLPPYLRQLEEEERRKRENRPQVRVEESTPRRVEQEQEQEQACGASDGESRRASSDSYGAGASLPLSHTVSPSITIDEFEECREQVWFKERPELEEEEQCERRTAARMESGRSMESSDACIPYIDGAKSARLVRQGEGVGGGGGGGRGAAGAAGAVTVGPGGKLNGANGHVTFANGKGAVVRSGGGAGGGEAVGSVNGGEEGAVRNGAAGKSGAGAVNGGGEEEVMEQRLVGSQQAEKQGKHGNGSVSGREMRPPVPSKRVGQTDKKAGGESGGGRADPRMRPLEKSCVGDRPTRRRHSAAIPDHVINAHFDRRRSLSPMTSMIDPLLSGRTSADIFRGSRVFGGDSFRSSRCVTPTRRMATARNSGSVDKASAKPPALLVYTNGDDVLFGRIREVLKRFIPVDRYTVFHLSSEALKKHPWQDQPTACLLVADTKGLDDAAWLKMQHFFNHSGKLVFICQNSLLAGLTSCESAKKQAGMLKMAFGDASSGLGKAFEEFLKKTLKQLRKTDQLDERFHSRDPVGGAAYSVAVSKAAGQPLLLYMENAAHRAAALFSDATSEQLLAPNNNIVRDSLERVGVQVCAAAAPQLTTGYMLTKEDEELEGIVGIRYGEECGSPSGPRLLLRRADFVAASPLPPATAALLPVQVGEGDSYPSSTFSSRAYFDRLRTARIGKCLMYVPVATTTMDVCNSVCDAIPGYEGFAVVAGQQVHGKGRAGNEFVSPLGCAMWSVQCVLPKSSSLASNPSFVQHVFAVAVVEAAKELSGQPDFPLCIKWPNDFYFNRSHKVGGMMITARPRDDSVHLVIGTGINVSNSNPTVCLNDMLSPDNGREMRVEEVVAETNSRFEELLKWYDLKGQDAFLKRYYEHWLHSREEVILEAEGGERCVIRGLDKWGYLEARSRKNPNKIYSISDDGNSFDMMKGLIRLKF